MPLSCIQQAPPLERLRKICIACLVVDALFVLIYGMAGMGYNHTQKMQCYIEHRYMWHEVVAISLMLSSPVAIVGGIMHGIVACSHRNTDGQLLAVSRYANALIVWTFIQAILEAIAYKQEPPECTAMGSIANEYKRAHGVMIVEDRTLMLYQVILTMLWVVWVTGCVAAGVIARQCRPLLLDEECEAPGGTVIGSPGGGGLVPQTVGMPVSQLPAGMVAVTGASADATGQVPQSGGPGPSAAGPGVVVAQGRPVSGAGPDCSGKPGSSSGSGNWEQQWFRETQSAGPA